MGKINIPFDINSDGRYTDQEQRKKDAITLETIQRIANALEELVEISSSENNIKGK